MRVSLIVATEPDAFRLKERDFFDSFAAQSHPHDALELIVVDSHARSSTASAFAAFRSKHPMLSISLLSCPSPARAVANNLAAAHATGELLIFLADDFDPSPDLVAAHAAYHRLNPDINAVGIGPGFFPDSVRRDLFARWQEDSGQLFGVPMRSTEAVWPGKYFFAGNASIKKAKFDALGGFDENFLYDAWDDYEFGLRWSETGGYSQFIAGAVAIHRHTVSFEERCVVMERAGRSARVLERLHPNHGHRWPALQRGLRAQRPKPHESAPTHVRIAFYSEQLDAAFRRGYLADDGSPM